MNTRRLAWCAVTPVVIMTALARCAKEPDAPPNIPPAELYIALGVAPRATTVAVGASQKLTVTPLNAVGGAIPGTPVVRYVSSDSTTISISPSGVVTGLQPSTGSPTFVTVTAQLNGVTQVDTVYASVTATRQAVASLSIHPPGSTPVNVPATVPAVVRDRSGNILAGVMPYFSVAPNTGTTIDPVLGTLTSYVMGKQWVHASVTAYGIPLADSVQYTFTPPLFGIVIFSDVGGHLSATRGPAALVDSLWVGVGASVAFFTESADTSIDVIFDDSTAIAGGNIHGLGTQATGTYVQVPFNTAGDYHWHVANVSPAVNGVIDVH
jgi:hypothetical protein